MSRGPRSIDARFALFCRTGDPGALGAVFDATAREILHLALWLAGNRPDAEDLVQRTFLLAIETRHKFEPGRPAVPWLLGLLAREARRLRRERARRAPATPSGAGGDDPEAAAAAAELRAAVHEVRAQLAAPYRDVLELHLEQGLNAKEIAARLRRPAGTVRTQLCRAMELLRKRLPSGFATGLVPFVPEVAELQHLKAAVVAAAKSAVPLPVAGGGAGVAILAASGGVLMAKKLAVVVPAFAVLVALGVYVTSLGGSASAGPDRSAVPAAKAVTVAGDPSGRTADPPAAAIGATERREATGPVTPADEGLAVIRGRCVDERGNPLAGCEVELDGAAAEDRYQDWVRAHPDREWQDPDPARTTTDGRFELRFAPLPVLNFALRASHPDRVPLEARWQSIAPGASIRLADAVMQFGARVCGRVVDEQGRPLPGVVITLEREPREVPDGVFKPCNPVSERCDALGRFTAHHAVAPGDYSPSIWEHTVALPARVAVPAGPGQLDVVLTVATHAELGTIEGTLVDARGLPIDAALVSSIPGSAWTRSAQDGSFRLVRAPAMPPAAVRLSVERDDYERLDTEAAHAWNTTGVRFVLERGVDLEVDAHTADGAPVPGYRATLFRSTARGFTREDSRRTRGRGVAGRVELDGTRRGACALVVEPDDAAFSATAFVPVEVQGPGPQRVDVVVSRTVERELVVQRADGTPVEGSTVRLVDGLGATVTFDTHVLPYRRWDRTGAPDKGVLVQETVTDAKGRVLLRGDADRPLDLVLLGPGHVPQIERAVSFATRVPLVVTVGSGATVVGRVHPPGVLGELRRLASLPPAGGVPRNRQGYLPAFRLSGPDGTSCPALGEPPVLLRDDGSFRIDGAPLGPCTLSLHYAVSHGSGVRLTTSETVALVELGAGETRTIEVDLARFVTGELVATLLHDGEPLRDTDVSIDCAPEPGPLGPAERTSVGARSDAEGRLRIRARPGRCLVEWQSIRAPQSAVLVSGRTTEQTFTFPSGTARLRVLGPAGAPVAGLHVRLCTADGTPVRGRAAGNADRTDSDGRIEAVLPPGSYSCQVLPERLLDPAAARAFAAAHGGDAKAFQHQMLRGGELTVRQGEVTEAVLRLPAAWSR